jgi:hypothetical protein
MRGSLVGDGEVYNKGPKIGSDNENGGAEAAIHASETAELLEHIRDIVRRRIPRIQRR